MIDSRAQKVKRDLELLQDAVKHLRKQQTVLQRLRACAHNEAQPIHRVPDEVLSSIFELGAPGAFNIWSVPVDPPYTHWGNYEFRRTR